METLYQIEYVTIRTQTNVVFNFDEMKKGTGYLSHNVWAATIPIWHVHYHHFNVQ